MWRRPCGSCGHATFRGSVKLSGQVLVVCGQGILERMLPVQDYSYRTVELDRAGGYHSEVLLHGRHVAGILETCGDSQLNSLPKWVCFR